MKRSGCPPFGVFSLLVTIATGSTIAPAQVAGQSLGGRVAAAARTERAPRLDGTLEDSVWKIAPIIGDFRQREPLETSPATERTEVRSEEHTSELQSHSDLVCRLLLEK